jgi:hypothetical protein
MSDLFAGGTLSDDNASVTLVSDAGTLNKSLGRVTSEALTTAAEAVEAFVVTNSKVTANSVIFASVRNYAGAGTPVVANITAAAGSFTVELLNSSASTALNAAVVFDFAVLGEITG